MRGAGGPLPSGDLQGERSGHCSGHEVPGGPSLESRVCPESQL